MSQDEHDLYQPPCPSCGHGVNKNDTERATVEEGAWWHRGCLARELGDEPKKVEMGWDVSWLRRIPHRNCATFFELYAKSVLADGDHTPRYEFGLTIFNFCVFEINYLNAYHEDE